MTIPSVPVQIGPAYHCFKCGAKGATLVAYFWPCGSPLDAWSLYIWYLKLPCRCRHASRVVRLGDCIAPLAVSDPSGLTPADIPAIQATLRAIAGAIPPEKRQCDSATRIVYALLAGSLTPYAAIDALQGLIGGRQPQPTLATLTYALPQPTPLEVDAIAEGVAP